MTELSHVEKIKRESRHLRGTLVESLQDPLTGAIREDDTVLIKFHGTYQQDDRDVREERRRQKLEPAYSFMIRTRLPGGVCSPQQWLQLDEIARRYGNGTLRLTTRQAFQLHGVIKTELKATMQALNAALIDTIAACGDVNRNVLASANPVETSAHPVIHEWTRKLSEHLLPQSRAYHEIWLDGEKLVTTEQEPLYGETYLPRKFKVAVVVPPINDVDVFAHDLGFIAIVEDGVLAGFNVTLGGGMGASHGDPETFPRLADVVGFVRPEQVLAVAEAVLTTQRDHGNRAVRKRARLKYTIEDRGLAWFVAEVTRRQGFALEPARPFTFTQTGDRFGWIEGHDGRWHLTLRIEAGRIGDNGGVKQLTGLREIAKVHRGDFRLTPNQNLIVANVEANGRAFIDALVVRYGLDRHVRATPVARDALACVALPTCGLAMAEAERYLPRLVQLVDERLAANGLAGHELVLRITGCPNGCARPYLAEVALVGKAPGRYNLFLGGDGRGQRLNALYLENVDEPTIVSALDAAFARYAAERVDGERFGDYAWRAGLVGAKAA
ncbi:MAG TPA: assimilatory sulfite reductase (NADPH) hemoprotein subunit [Steroidobacteraceae bacterium]|nr:assimilatory sulfite reductase (NADPH) hemoprotein subunit [Steroidobacteraceae bacterium]HET9694613.1 assimilatory sulfite reductase (NADPH) hemoprotein subunit [Steroidobacteraceae bacterium]